MSFKDALAGSSARQSAFETGTIFDPSLGSSGAGSNPILDQQATDGLQNLADMGYTVNDDGSVTTPEGENFTAADYASAGSLMNKGMSADIAGAAINGISNMKEAALLKTGISTEEPVREVASIGGSGVGGGGVSDSNPSGGDVIIEEIEYRNKNKNKKARMPAKEAAQLSKNFNGDPIGIGMANLFLIVHQKYNEKKKLKTEFINREY